MAIQTLGDVATPEGIQWCLDHLMLKVPGEDDGEAGVNDFPCQLAILRLQWRAIPAILSHVEGGKAQGDTIPRLAWLLKKAIDVEMHPDHVTPMAIALVKSRQRKSGTTASTRLASLLEWLSR
ncbi:MAG: hypothetical protein R3B13_00005 [Polyangiaceae bacterium]